MPTSAPFDLDDLRSKEGSDEVASVQAGTQNVGHPRATSHASSTSPAWTRLLTALAQPPPTHTRRPRWWPAYLWQRQQGRCAYCGLSVSDPAQRRVDALVPEALGGPHHLDAMIACCASCQRAKGGRDVLLWRPDLPDSLRQRRNHLKVDPDRPRFACAVARAATGGYLGWRSAADVPAEVVFRLRWKYGATLLEPPYARGNPVPLVLGLASIDHMDQAIADLIECQGQLRYA